MAVRSFRRGLRAWLVRALIVAACAADTSAAGARLRPETLQGWQAYLAAVESRRAQEAAAGDRFLVLDFQADREAERRAITGGDVLVSSLSVRDQAGRAIDVPSGLVHHWRGAVFIPGRGAADLVTAIQFADPPALQDDVVRSAVLARGRDTERVYLRLQRKSVVTAVYNTEHDVTFQRIGQTRASSVSVATHIAEVRNAGAADEFELPLGADRGFLWGVVAYWRYQSAPGGAIAECESVVLSRDVPTLFSFMAGPLIDRAARESMERMLTALRARYAR